MPINLTDTSHDTTQNSTGASDHLASRRIEDILSVDDEERFTECISELEQMKYADLQAVWRRLFRTQPPKRVAYSLLLLAISWKLQESSLGGINIASKQQFKSLGEAKYRNRCKHLRSTKRLKPGVILVREWRGDKHIVSVLPDGFEWQGKHWDSLSAIAREITGTRWSGPRFFGLK